MDLGGELKHLLDVQETPGAMTSSFPMLEAGVLQEKVIKARQCFTKQRRVNVYERY